MAKGIPKAFLCASVAVFFCSLLLLTRAQAQAPEGTVRLEPSISNVPAESDGFEIYVVLEELQHDGRIFYDDDDDTVPDRGIESNGLGAFELTIEYDQRVVAVADVEEGPELERTGRNFQCLPPTEEPGKFAFACLSIGPEPAGPQGSLTLATVRLRPLGRGSTPLLLEVGLAGPLGDEAPVEAIGGVVRVAGSSVATATRTRPRLVTATPTSRPDGTVVTPTSSDRTPATPTASVTAEDGRTRESPTTPVVGDGDPGDSQTDGNGDLQDQEDSPPGAAVWWAVALGSTVLGALGLAAMLWGRRRRQRGAGG